MKQNLALVVGGYSGEYEISIKSSVTIANNLDAEKYNIYKIYITREAWWYESDNQKKIHVDKNDFSLTIDGQKINFDLVFIGIHGTPGEDGKLQGYFDMLGIKYTGCNSIVSALSFNKGFCNKVLKTLNVVNIANSVVIYKHIPYSLGVILEQVKLPVFVKPNESGSSLGVSKVMQLEELVPAIEKAFQEDNQIIIEEYIEGREFSMGVYAHDGKIMALPPTEIVSKKEFFDYEAKYTSGVTDEITPANLEESIVSRMSNKSIAVYQALNCSGVVRIDYILNKHNGKIYFLEVNTMPGQSENSLIPQQVRAAGMNLKEFYQIVIDEAFKR
jgi:D-alanine-D-alanine ligase